MNICKTLQRITLGAILALAGAGISTPFAYISGERETRAKIERYARMNSDTSLIDAGFHLNNGAKRYSLAHTSFKDATYFQMEEAVRKVITDRPESCLGIEAITKAQNWETFARTISDKEGWDHVEYVNKHYLNK